MQIKPVFIFCFIFIASCGFFVEKDMKSKIEEIKKVKGAFTEDIEENISSGQKIYEEAIEVCDKDTSMCEELGLRSELTTLYEEIEAFKSQKELYDKIKSDFVQIETCAESQYSKSIEGVENYIKRYPKGYKIDEVYEFRDEFLKKEFYRLNKASALTSITESSLAYDGLIAILNNFLIKVRKEEYRREFNDKIEELKIERDRLKEREIQEEANEEQTRIQDEARRQDNQRLQNAQNYQSRYNSAVNNLISAMASKAKSVAGKGHSLNCDALIQNESVTSQNKIGNRVEITKSYYIQIGGDSWASMCQKSFERVTVSGYVEGDGSRYVDYNVTSGSKN